MRYLLSLVAGGLVGLFMAKIGIDVKSPKGIILIVLCWIVYISVMLLIESKN